MAGFLCPFCRQTMSIEANTLTEHFLNYYSHSRSAFDAPHLRVRIFKCPNIECAKETIIVDGRRGYINGREVRIHPAHLARIYPDYIPSAIRQDYEEACSIIDQSPKAAATLARRCLQGMIRDFWKISGKRNLQEEVEAISDKVPASQWKAIDSLRKIGNIGAHMEKDVDLIIDVEPDEASMLIHLIELLLEKWYVARHDEEELYESITQTGLQKALDRKGHKEGH